MSVLMPLLPPPASMPPGWATAAAGPRSRLSVPTAVVPSPTATGILERLALLMMTTVLPLQLEECGMILPAAY